MREPVRIILTEPDCDRLEKLLAQVPKSASRDSLQAELDRAEVVPPASLPPKVVTMDSRVRYRDERTGKEIEVTIVYPKDADIGKGKVSVLAPVGSALLGLAVGQTIEWRMPDGRPRTLRVCEVLHQPEKDGQMEEA